MALRPVTYLITNMITNTINTYTEKYRLWSSLHIRMPFVKVSRLLISTYNIHLHVVVKNMLSEKRFGYCFQKKTQLKSRWFPFFQKIDYLWINLLEKVQINAIICVWKQLCTTENGTRYFDTDWVLLWSDSQLKKNGQRKTLTK